MSVINKMLQDLEQRRNQDPTQVGDEGGPALVATSSKYKVRKSFLIYMIALLVVVMVVIFFLPSKPKKAALPLVKNEIVAQQAGTQNAVSVIKSPQEDIASTQIQKIQFVTNDAGAQLIFTLSNAVRYELQHDLDSHQATILLADTDLNKVEIPEIEKNPYLVSILTDTISKNVYVTLRLTDSAYIKHIGAGDNATNTVVIQLALQKSPSANSATSTTATTNTSLTNSTVDDDVTTASTQQQVAQSYQDILALIDKGQTDLALQKLQDLLNTAPGNNEARQTLVVLLIKSNKLVDAEQVLQVGLAASPDYIPFVELQAKLLVQQNNLQGALAVLEQHSPALTEDPEYYALMAELQRRTGNGEMAVNLYQQLVSTFPQRSVWWMGLGMAQESLGSFNSALSSYRQALATGQLSPYLAAYAQSRIVALGG